MLNLEDLFDVSDYKRDAAGGKRKSTSKEKKGASKEGSGKKEKPKKGIRYPLPVRVRAGHVRCDLLKQDYEGKTVSEEDVKKKIRECFPELSGVQFNLVNFGNKFTEMIEMQEKLRLTEEESKKEADCLEKETDALEFAAAEDEGIPEDDTDSESEDDEEEVIEDVEENEPDESFSEEVSPKAKANDEVFLKGCWLKLEIHYQELAENQKVTYPVSVVAGSTHMEFGSDTVSVDEVREKWVAVHPEYENCLFHYDDRQDILIPFVRGEGEVKGRKYRLPLAVGYLDLMEHYGVEDFEGAEDGVTISQIRALYTAKYPEFDNAIFACAGNGSILFPVMSFKKADTSDRYSLPIVVRGPGFRLDMNASDFKGKGEVTLEEIRCALELVYPEFSKERTEMVYDERGFVVPILRGSKKGVLVTSERAGQNLIFTTGRDGRKYRIEQMPYGYFDCALDGNDVCFRLCSDRIPGRILKEIIGFFRKDFRKEAAVQIFYDLARQDYELYYPQQKTETCSVVFIRNPELEKEKVLMMDVHSHGRMDAFFSAIDDHDEKGTRLFMVIGKLDGAVQCRLRAGIAGFYRDISVREVFDLKEDNE